MYLRARMWTPAQLAEAMASPERRDELLSDEPSEELPEVDADKAWHGIHWLLTGSPDETPPTPPRRGLFRRGPSSPVGAEAMAVLGGEPIGEDNGYGPARLLRPDQVSAVAEALRPLTPEALGHRMDPAAMAAAELYPGIWDEENVYEEYLGPSYEGLRQFYLDAAERGAAVVLELT